MTKKISRRDAIKLLGAVTGASLLANLPSKWSTPELVSGVLPAHAQTSGFTILRQRNGADINCGVEVCDEMLLDHEVQISGGGNLNLIPMRWTINNVINGNLGLQSPNGTTGVSNTDPSGIAFIEILYNGLATRYDLTWTFDNPLHGSGSCTVTYKTGEDASCTF